MAAPGSGEGWAACVFHDPRLLFRTYQVDGARHSCPVVRGGRRPPQRGQLVSRGQPGGQARARVAYLVSQYPALSHTFIETEVEALRALGAEVHTFSVRRAGHMLSHRSRCESRRTVVLQNPLASSLALARLVSRSPRAILLGLSAALRSGPLSARARLWQVFYLLEALVLWDWMRRRELRHVHVHFANSGADIARLAVILGAAVDGPDAGWAWSLTMHGPTEFDDRVRQDLPAKYRAAAFIACISDFTRSQVMRDLPPAQWGKVRLVRMGVNAAQFLPARQREGRPSHEVLQVLAVGRLVPEKGLPIMLSAVQALKSRGVPVRLLVAGGGQLFDELFDVVQRQGLVDQVELMGPVSPDLMPDLYRSADVFCLPSFAEGLPVVLMEAMASELPVVSTAISGIPELVDDGVTGVVVPAGRADLIADALHRLAADGDLRRRLGLAAREAVQRDHDPAVNAAALLELLEECARRRRR